MKARDSSHPQPGEIFSTLSVNPNAEHSLISQIKKQIAWLIASRKLAEGDTLPSVRGLAKMLRVNMHTVRLAYNRLEAEGLIETRTRARARVRGFDPLRVTASSGRVRSHTVGIILPSMSNPFYQAFLKGVQSIAEKNDTLTFLCSTYDDEALAWRYFDQLVASGVDGAISVSHDMSALARSELDAGRIPLVSADYPAPSGYSIELDHERSGCLATEHLLQHGRGRIALVRYAVDTPAVEQIQRGYESVLRAAGRSATAEIILRVNGYDRASGEEAARRLLALPRRPDAVFLIADQLAIGAIQAFQQAGVRVPQEIAVASFNNIPEAAWINPALTTVAAPAEPLGQAAMHMLNELIAGQPPRHRNLRLSCQELVIRQSCGCPRS